MCRALGLTIHNGSAWQHLKKLEASEKRVLTRNSTNLNGGDVILFGKHVPSVAVISESGLYRLILRADKAEARAFQDWAAANSNNPIIGALKLGVGTTGSQRYLKRLAADEKMTVTRKTLDLIAGVGGDFLGK